MIKKRRYMALIILISFLATMNPAWLNPASAAVPVVNNVYIERTDNSVLETVGGVIELDGTDLADVSVRVLTSGGGGSKKLGTDIGERTSNDADFVKFELSGTEMRSINWTGGLIVSGFATIPVDESDMPAITGVSPGVVYTGSVDPVTITGSNLDNDTLTFGNGDVNGTVGRNADEITISDITGDLGLHDVIFTRVNPPAACGSVVTFAKLYQNQFRVVQELNIDDLEMYPNTGVAGETTVYFQAPGLADYSVFFLRDTTDPFYSTNMGTDYEHISNPLPDNSLIKVTVPSLPAGTYHVLLTNYMTDPPSGEDLRSLITQELLVDEFIVVSAANAAQISAVAPASGPTLTNNAVNVIGYNFEEINIDHLAGVSDLIDVGDLSLSESDTVLTISYGAGTYTPGEIPKAVTVTREIKAIIASLATFQDLDEQEFVNGNYDTVKITTEQISDAAIASDPIQDVVLEIKTILTVSPTESYVFTQRAAKANGFTFIKSYTEPTISDVTPDKIQVIKDGTYETKEEMYIGISGGNFMVTNYTDPGGNNIIHYPVVDMGGYLYFRRDGNNSSYVYDRDDVLIDGATMEVFSGDEEVNGSSGNDTGDRILIKIPAGLKLTDATGVEISSAALINILTYVAVTNPRKDSSDYGYPVGEHGNNLFTYVEVADTFTPEITCINPSIVSTDGYNGVVIEGNKFEPNVKLYLEDELISCTRDATGKKITFNAPAWEAGRTRLLVMNPDGGQDSIGLTYVLSQSSPDIRSLSPPAGTIGTLVTINGSQFLSPDPTAVPVDLGIYRLIGTRVLFGDIDINDYYIDPLTGDIGLQEYEAADEILSISGSSAVLADYYYSVLLKESADEYYIVKYSNDGDVILTNGSEEYTVYVDGGLLKASSGSGGAWDVAVTNSTVTITRGIDSHDLDLVTPYEYDLGTKEIEGNRVKVADNGTRIYAIVPDLIASGVYDVSVVNPDTNSDTLTDAFTFYRQPQRLPVVTGIDPDTGSVSGGYFIRITGENFEDNGTIKTRVFINAIEVAKADVIVGLDGTTLDVKVPAYPGDLKEDWGTDHKAVPVALLNPSDGGAIGIEDAFTYILTSSSPVIDSLSKTEGTAAGGQYIEIIGRDFRFYEPFDDQDGDFEYDAGEDYTNLNGNAQWDDFSEAGSVEDLPDPDVDTDVLPTVYFGTQKATLKNFGNGYLGVITPVATAGTVDVYVVNNDYGISNKIKFTYKSSTPKITSVIPSVGKKQGQEIVEILGSGFVESSIDVYHAADTITNQDMTLVRFGDISNLGDEDAGIIIDGEISEMELAGNMIVDYSADLETIYFSVTQAGTEYEMEFSGYDGNTAYFDLQVLEDSEGNAYPGYELVKAYVQDRRLIIERGYSPSVDTESGGQLIVSTPSYYTVGTVPLRVINPDGGTATSQFEYKNPATHPYIHNITRDGEDPIAEDTQRVLPVNYKGNRTIAVFGGEFLYNATIQVGDVLTIEADDITATLNTDPQKLSFVMPEVPESAVGDLLKVVVTNEDGGVASSETPDEGDPIYILITKGESEPAVDSVTPAVGPASGGTSVTITGKDFRETMDGYEDEVKVYFGATMASDVNVIDYYTITATTTASDPGEVEVKVQNPDGEVSSPTGTFTFISTPTISEVTVLTADNQDSDSEAISIEGGQTVRISGTGFMANCRVVFAPEIALTASTDGSLIYLLSSTAGELDTYELLSGSEGSEVTVTNSTTLTVKTPNGKLDTAGLMVINPDNGASPIFTGLSYALPQLDAPGGVTAYIVHDDHYDTDRFIKVQWNPITGASAYEIYVVRGNDEEFLASSIYTSLIYSDLEPNTSYKFIVKAVGDFGSSPPSEESERVRTGDEVGAPDLDGSLGEETRIEAMGGIVSVNIGRDNGKDVSIDLTSASYTGAREVQVTIPARVIYGSVNYDVKIMGPDYQLIFNPEVFRSSSLDANRSDDDAGIKFRIYPYTGNSGIQGGDNLSTVYRLEATSFVGQNSTQLENLYSNMLFNLVYDNAKARLRRFTNTSLYYGDLKTGSWSPVSYGTNSAGQAIVKRLGLYSVIGSRR